MLRTINKALDEVKKVDKETAVTAYTIRSWAKDGKIRSISAGTRVLIDVESLFDYINNSGR